MIGKLEHHIDFASEYVSPRNVDVWLPPHYEEQDVHRFPVVYMHDGQNLFDPQTSYIGVDWEVTEALERLVAQRKVPGAMIVGIRNSPQRLQEYLPQKPIEASKLAKSRIQASYSGPALSDHYLRFMVHELKPFVDARYRTLPDGEHTFVMGSSLGGLISLYVVCEYPHLFGGAACLSTHWPAIRQGMIRYLKRALPRPGRHKIYFDYGIEGQEASYATYQQQVDRVMRSAGYEEGKDWMTRVFPGAEHSERAWRERVHIPLEFLLGGLTALS
jgi:predicted alpha/beta superfamily hydrolase